MLLWDLSVLQWEKGARGSDGLSSCLSAFRYVERKNFLERVDHRQFELEKAVRLSNMKR